MKLRNPIRLIRDFRNGFEIAEEERLRIRNEAPKARREHEKERRKLTIRWALLGFVLTAAGTAFLLKFQTERLAAITTQNAKVSESGIPQSPVQARLIFHPTP